jgi:phosphatidate cytidylyltransferase
MTKPREQRMSNLAWRVVVALIGAPAAVLVLYAGDLALALFLAVLAALGAKELYAIARAGGNGAQPFDLLGITLAAAVPLVTHLVRLGWIDAPLAAAGVLFVSLFGIAVWGRAPSEGPLAAVAITMFGVLYCGATLSFAYALRHHRWIVDAAGGTALVLYPIVLTWLTDTGAYFVGRALGKRKLMPSVSPGKTVAGAVGGLVVAVAASVAWNSLVLRPAAQLALTPLAALTLGLVVGVAVQIGDLAESLLKREAGVKDSSTLLPGHGGILDRLDSIYFALPVGYLLLSRLLLPAPR